MNEVALEEFAIFRDLDAAAVALLRKRGVVYKAERDGVLHTPTERCSSVGFILRGAVRMTKLFSSGKELVIRNLHSGETFGELICFAGTNYPAWVVASQQSTVFELSVDSLRSLFSGNQFVFSFMREMSIKSLHLSEKIELLSLRRVTQKVAYFFLSLYEQHGSPSFPLSRTITELAEQAGSSREAVSRALKELETAGCIKRRGNRVTILELKRLESILVG